MRQSKSWLKNDMDAMFHQVDRIVFVEDEVTTGNTILNIINILEKSIRTKCGLPLHLF